MSILSDITDECSRLEQRAEAAEALIGHISLACGFPIVGDLGQVTETICKRISRVDAKVAELEAQNARLRAALEDVSLLAHCISKAGPLNTPDLETAWRKFDLISVKAAEALVDRKAALNGEEASK